jgi:lipopolysaccharide export LptBFGC system permease protein LptF
MFSASFPTLLDDYILRDFFIYLGMILSTFLVLVIVFTLFELLGDILRNQVPPTVVAEYLLNVTPYLLYNVAPLVMLLAVLVTFGLMQRSNEITAIKATGTSIYRIVTPVIVAAGVLAVGLFFADQFYLPRTNQRQEALHNQIKGKPPQTYLRPDRKWIFGQNHDIYYYQFFDTDRDQFGNVTVFQLDQRQLLHHAPHPRRPRPLGRQSESLGLRTRLGALPQRLCHGQLPRVRRGHLPRFAGDAVVLQEGSEAVYRDELRRA